MTSARITRNVRTGASAQAAISRLTDLGTELTRLGWEARVSTHPGMLPALLIRDTAPGAPEVAEYLRAVQLGQRWHYQWSRSCGADPARAAAIISHVMRSARNPEPPPPITREPSRATGPGGRS